MALVVCPEVSLRTVESAIVAATHSLVDVNGDKILIGTIDSRTLKTAALMALQIATGHVTWPGDEAIRVRQARPAPGVLVTEDGR